MFTLGQIYHRRNELHGKYGGQQQGGISTPVDHPFIMLFTAEIGKQYGYHDGWDENGVFSFIGEGQKGDMDFIRGNKSLRDHAKDGKTIELFESLGKQQGYRYIGEFICLTYDYRQDQDVAGNDRRVIVFHLVPICDTDLYDEDIRTNDATYSDNLQSMREKAYAAPLSVKKSNKLNAKRLVHERSKDVRDYVLIRANGICESCKNPAPFNRADGTPYLEAHHTRRLSDGGPDHPRWVGAVCPNCHCEIHSGESGTRKNEELKELLSDLEKKGI